jgi:hypothetical protein
MEQQLAESSHQPLNGSIIPPAESKQYALLPKQQEYFQQVIRAVNELQQQMRVALQMIAWERGLTVAVRLSDDCTRLVETQ